ncbi:hypothetical protein [Akkermansia muciniphila]|nr:hypothetical protein [Akkermansia muciniphila]QBH17947.1 hypothetical protein EYB66_02775 [Akkermansia muciniphila]QWP66910.1 hypothetical protein J5W61_03875 [Akkermansia muciniphila]
MRKFQDFIDASTKMNNECFDGGNKTHNDESNMP